MTDLTDEEAKALLAECDNPDCLTCEYARALLDARAELSRVKADAAAAQARGMERAAGILDVRADVALVDMGASAETVDALGAAADAIRAAAAATRKEDG